MELIDTNTIKIFRNKIFSSNTYLLGNRLDNTCIIIDPGLDTTLLLETIKESQFKPLAILSTHGHFDHIGSAANIQNLYNIPFYLHELDYKISQSANFFLQVARISQKIITPKPDFVFKLKKENLVIGNFNIEITNYPGHSNGSCVFKINDYLFTGDILYKNGLGPESMPKEDKKLLKDSILNIFSTFSDNCLIFPGHGSSEYLGVIKKNNLELKEFIST